jgi:hypothetical protein
MTSIPSTERTNDFIYRVELKKGAPSNDRKARNLLVFEAYVEPLGALHSMDITILRDGQRATDIDFRSFEHVRGNCMSYVKLAFCEKSHRIGEHGYLLTIILRYLMDQPVRLPLAH